MRLHPDHWHSIARFCDVRTLCRLMRVSREWFTLWATERAWRHQRQRMCARHPELEALFAAHARKDASSHYSSDSIKSNSNKKRKTAWITPRSGTWYVFKRWLSKAFCFEWFKTLLREATKKEMVLPLIFAAIKEHVPFQHCITSTKMYYSKDDYKLVLYMSRSDAAISYKIINGCFGIDAHYRGVFKLYNNRPGVCDMSRGDLASVLFRMWKYFVLETPFIPFWTQEFEDAMRNVNEK